MKHKTSTGNWYVLAWIQLTLWRAWSICGGKGMSYLICCDLVQLLLSNYRYMILKWNLWQQSFQCWTAAGHHDGLSHHPCDFLLQTPPLSVAKYLIPQSSGFQRSVWGNFSFKYAVENGCPASTTSITLALISPAHLPNNVTAYMLVLAGTSQKQREMRIQQC